MIAPEFCYTCRFDVYFEFIFSCNLSILRIRGTPILPTLCCRLFRYHETVVVKKFVIFFYYGM